MIHPKPECQVQPPISTRKRKPRAGRRSIPPLSVSYVSSCVLAWMILVPQLFFFSDAVHMMSWGIMPWVDM